MPSEPRESDAQLAMLIRRLAEREPADDISDDVVNAEVSAVRQSRKGNSAENSR